MRNFKADPQAIMDAHAKSFSWAARFLSRQARAHAAQLYAFARLMDDLIDEPSMGSEQNRMAQFEVHCLQMLAPAAHESVGQSVGLMLQAFGVEQQVKQSFLDALRADAQPRQLQSLLDVMRFAYGVAGTVGQMMRPILGAEPEADRYAVALGMAMQLTNIARDVLEDAQRGRCYLPADWLPHDFQLSALMDGEPQARQHAFVAIDRLLQEAEQLYALAERGFSSIPHENRRAIEVACFLYRGIGRKILHRGMQVYWQRRAHLSAWEKLRCVMQVWVGRSSQVSQVAVQKSADPFVQYQADLQGIPGFPRAWV